jgi:hypothetical protein
MAKKKETAREEIRTEANRAKAAFDEYKSRMGGGAHAAMYAAKEPMSGISANYPYMHGMMGAPANYPYAHGMMGAPYHPSFAHPSAHPRTGHPHAYQAPGGSLFENIGNMLRLGVELTNVGLAGGIQVMEGLSGGSSCHGDYSHHGGYSHHGSSCGTPHTSCCDPCYSDCHSCCDPCCNPSVHGCC